MPSETRNITHVVMTETDLPRDIESVRRKCLKLPMIKDCEAEIASFSGRPLGNGAYLVDVAGSFRIKTAMQVGVTIEATGTGEIDSAGETVEIKDIKILNDVGGIFSKVLGMAGVSAGQKLNLRPRDSASIRAALAA